MIYLLRGLYGGEGGGGGGKDVKGRGNGGTSLLNSSEAYFPLINREASTKRG